jgi:hypothetical protein
MLSELLELPAQALSNWRVMHLTRYGESRVERQAGSSQNQVNYLSNQTEATSDEKLS